MLSGMVLSPFSFPLFMSGLGQTVTEMCCFAMVLSGICLLHKTQDMSTNDAEIPHQKITSPLSVGCSHQNFNNRAMDALISELVQPLLILIDHNHKPFISHQEGVAKQMYVLVLLYNYYRWKQHLQLEFLSLETLYKIVVLTNGTLLAYLEKTVSLSQNPSGR